MSAEAEQEIASTLRARPAHDIDMIDVTCGGNLCRLEVAGTTDAAFDTARSLLLLEHPPHGRGYTRIIDNNENNAVAVHYIARAGQTLPDLN